MIFCISTIFPLIYHDTQYCIPWCTILISDTNEYVISSPMILYHELQFSVYFIMLSTHVVGISAKVQLSTWLAGMQEPDVWSLVGQWRWWCWDSHSKWAAIIVKTGWWLTYPSENYELVNWDQWKNQNVPSHQPVKLLVLSGDERNSWVSTMLRQNHPASNVILIWTYLGWYWSPIPVIGSNAIDPQLISYMRNFHNVRCMHLPCTQMRLHISCPTKRMTNYMQNKGLSGFDAWICTFAYIF